MKVISHPSDMDKLLPPRWADSFSARKRAVEIYLRGGGIIKVGEMKGNWPRLYYPTKEKLEQEIKEVERELERVEKQLSQARRRLGDLEENVTKAIKVKFDPLYWEHRMKMMRDREYREVFELVRPPMHLLHRPEWRRKLEMFIKSEEYRMRLKEARLSKIGRRREVLEKEVERRTEFSKSVVLSLIDKLEEKKRDLKERLEALRVLLSWAES